DILNGGDEDTSTTGSTIGYLRDHNDSWDLQGYPGYWGMSMIGTKWALQGSTAPHTFVNATSSDSNLAAYGCLRPDGTLAVIAINHSANSITSTIQVAGFTPQATANRYEW